MILYLDTSALVKRYFKEPYTEDVIAWWQKADEIIKSRNLLSHTYNEERAAETYKKCPSYLSAIKDLYAKLST